MFIKNDKLHDVNQKLSNHRPDQPYPLCLPAAARSRSFFFDNEGGCFIGQNIENVKIRVKDKKPTRKINPDQLFPGPGSQLMI